MFFIEVILKYLIVFILNRFFFIKGEIFKILFIKIFFFFFLHFRATPAAYGGSQDRGQIRAAVAGLHQSHSNAGSETCLQPTAQLTATPDP